MFTYLYYLFHIYALSNVYFEFSQLQLFSLNISEFWCSDSICHRIQYIFFSIFYIYWLLLNYKIYILYYVNLCHFFHSHFTYSFFSWNTLFISVFLSLSSIFFFHICLVFVYYLVLFIFIFLFSSFFFVIYFPLLSFCISFSIIWQMSFNFPPNIFLCLVCFIFLFAYFQFYP